MPALDGVSWPPEPIATQRLVLRAPMRGDHDTFLELYSSAEVFAHLGGPRDREVLEAELDSVDARGRFVVTLDEAMIGTVTLDRRDPARPGRVLPGRVSLEMSYLFLPATWGRGYAAEACSAALMWAGVVLPGEPVVLCTQLANRRSVRLAERLGFVEKERFEEFGAEQWFGVRHGSRAGRPEWPG